MSFYRNFHEREFEAAFSFLEFIQSRIPRGIGCDRPHWCLNGNGKFDTQSFYYKIKGTSPSCFPWKGIWKVKVPMRVAFVLWTAAHGRILTLDNLMLRGLSLANRCCMCCCFAESVGHLPIHCPVAYSSWVQMLQAFGIQWVMPGLVESLVFCWSKIGWGNFLLTYGIWFLAVWCGLFGWKETGALLRLWRERLISYKLSAKILFEWARCWGSSNCSSTLEFLSSLRSAP